MQLQKFSVDICSFPRERLCVNKEAIIMAYINLIEVYHKYGITKTTIASEVGMKLALK